MRRDRNRWSVAVVALTLLMAACASADGGAESTTTSEATTTTTPSTSTTTTVPPTTSTSTTTTTTSLVPPEPIPIEPPDGYELVWHDEFDGPEIDPANWTYDIGGWGWGNGEAQYYTDRPENARIEQGILVIEARFERFEDSYYTSARLKTEDLQEFQYGYIEARIKVPEGSGVWPAFWMLGHDFERNPANPIEANWPDIGEIDIMEFVGREPNITYGTIHGPGYAGAGGIGKWNRQDEPIPLAWHTYAIEWDAEGITWFFDGEPFGDVHPEDLSGREWVFDKPFFMLLNLALGGSFAGPIGLNTQFPAYMLVDYVRVYQRPGE